MLYLIYFSEYIHLILIIGEYLAIPFSLFVVGFIWKRLIEPETKETWNEHFYLSGLELATIFIASFLALAIRSLSLDNVSSQSYYKLTNQNLYEYLFVTFILMLLTLCIIVIYVKAQSASSLKRIIIPFNFSLFVCFPILMVDIVIFWLIEGHKTTIELQENNITILVVFVLAIMISIILYRRYLRHLYVRDWLAEAASLLRKNPKKALNFYKKVLDYSVGKSTTIQAQEGIVHSTLGIIGKKDNFNWFEMNQIIFSLRIITNLLNNLCDTDKPDLLTINIYIKHFVYLSSKINKPELNTKLLKCILYEDIKQKLMKSIRE